MYRPRGVRSRMASSWAAISCSVRSGAAALMPATKRISRSSAALRPRALQQGSLDQAFRDQSPHRAAQALDRPGFPLAPVQDADDVAPRLLGAHSPHRREPGIQLGENAIEVRGIASVCRGGQWRDPPRRGRLPGKLARRHGRGSAARMETARLDCLRCGICCVEYAGAVAVEPSDQVPHYLTRSVRGVIGFASWEEDSMRRMASKDGRCIALRGEVGKACHCSIYSRRPVACRDFEVGSHACLKARESLRRG